MLDISAADLSSLSPCGFYSGESNDRFGAKMDYAFKGRLQWCSRERNLGTSDIEKWARRSGKDAYRETVARFNCTGTDPIEHPQVDLRPPHFLDPDRPECASTVPGGS